MRITFHGGAQGPWAVTRLVAVAGEGLAPVARLRVDAGAAEEAPDSVWRLAGVVGHARYATRAEIDTLAAVQPPLARPEATCAALIPIRKSPAWWALAQDERRAIFEETSHHTAIGLRALPAVARRLHHGRDLGEPFDFLTWFEFAPAQADAFEALVAALRATREWDFVEREVDIRLVRDAPADG
jgi:hypothetical protein